MQFRKNPGNKAKSNTLLNTCMEFPGYHNHNSFLLLPLQVPISVRMVSSAVTVGNAYQLPGNVIILLTVVPTTQMKPIVCYNLQGLLGY